MIGPLKLDITAEEKILLKRVVFDPPRDEHFQEVLRRSCNAGADLARSLLSRKAIPDIRLRYFTDPRLNIGKTKKSRKQVFEANGTTGEAILEHAHFLPYLKYFVFGPDLPAEAIDQFHSTVSAELFISDGDMDALWQMARNATRMYALNPRVACEEYFKLALECGVPETYARSIRDAVRNVRILTT